MRRERGNTHTWASDASGAAGDLPAPQLIEAYLSYVEIDALIKLLKSTDLYE
jgi:hypothetical protein